MLCELVDSERASEAKIEQARVILQSETEPLTANNLYFKGSCTYYVITNRGGGSFQMITVLHRGGLAK